MITYEYDYNFKENCTLQKIYLNGNHAANKLIANEGYVLDLITESEQVLEDGTIIPKMYYRTVQSPISYDFADYVAVLEEEGMDIAGVTDKPEVM